MTIITLDDLCAAIWDRAATVVDALPPGPYRSRHLPGACNLVYEDAEVAAATVLPDRHAAIVTYSTNAACGRGDALAERLEDLGYTNVRVYRDGIEEWVNAGLPIEIGDGVVVTR